MASLRNPWGGFMPGEQSGSTEGMDLNLGGPVDPMAQGPVDWGQIQTAGAGPAVPPNSPPQPVPTAPTPPPSSIHPLSQPGVAADLQDEFAAYRKLDSKANATDVDLYNNDDFQRWLSTGEAPNRQNSNQAPQSDVMSELRGLFRDGQPNQEIINRRTEGARENLDRFSKSRNATNRAALASRGLIGDGPEQSAQNRVEEDIADRYSGAVSQIYADELGRGDDRMMEALRLAAGIEQGGLDRQLSEKLGLGNLALGNYRAQTDYDLGLGNLGLGRDRLAADIQSGGVDQLLALLQLLTQGARQSAEGYY